MSTLSLGAGALGFALWSLGWFLLIADRSSHVAWILQVVGPLLIAVGIITYIDHLTRRIGLVAVILGVLGSIACAIATLPYAINPAELASDSGMRFGYGAYGVGLLLGFCSVALALARKESVFARNGKVCAAGCRLPLPRRGPCLVRHPGHGGGRTLGVGHWVPAAHGRAGRQPDGVDPGHDRYRTGGRRDNRPRRSPWPTVRTAGHRDRDRQCLHLVARVPDERPQSHRRVPFDLVHGALLLLRHRPPVDGVQPGAGHWTEPQPGGGRLIRVQWEGPRILGRSAHQAERAGLVEALEVSEPAEPSQSADVDAGVGGPQHAQVAPAVAVGPEAGTVQI